MKKLALIFIVLVFVLVGCNDSSEMKVAKATETPEPIETIQPTATSPTATPEPTATKEPTPTPDMSWCSGLVHFGQAGVYRYLPEGDRCFLRLDEVHHIDKEFKPEAIQENTFVIMSMSPPTASVKVSIFGTEETGFRMIITKGEPSTSYEDIQDGFEVTVESGHVFSLQATTIQPNLRIVLEKIPTD